MIITVAVCTWNRSISLSHTLQSFVDMRIPTSIEWEVLVINNNSNDDTDVIIDSFRDRLPVRRIFEKIQGLSNARNSGAQAARGKYIIWTDDDVLVGSEWLAAYCCAFEKWPHAAIFGGPVYPKFEEPIPPWLRQGWHVVPSAFASVDFGSVALPLSSSRLPYGANFALRRAEQLIHLYDPALGASPTGRYYSEETTVMRKILNEGAEGWWIPEASVQHCIPQKRMTVAYINSYFEKQGRTDYYLSHRQINDHTIHLLGRPRWIWRRMIEDELKYWSSRIFCPAESWLVALRNRSMSRGAFHESYRF